MTWTLERLPSTLPTRWGTIPDLARVQVSKLMLRGKEQLANIFGAGLTNKWQFKYFL
jgi:hypothetical protein